MTKIFNPISEALQELRPGCAYNIRDAHNGIVWTEILDNGGNPTGEFDASNISWFSDTKKPTREEIEPVIARIQAAYDALEYQRLRQPEYPLLADLADALYWQAQGDESKMTAYLAAVEAVKQKYPKGV